MIFIYQQAGIDFFDLTRKVIKKNLNIEACSRGFFNLTKESYNPSRSQYDSSAIVKEISQMDDSSNVLKLGIINVDIYARGMNFIFGLADPLRKTAIVSICRLAGENLNERMAKEVIHELGHLLGLVHCSNPQCVMYFSNTIADTDHKEINLCDKCKRKIEY